MNFKKLEPNDFTQFKEILNRKYENSEASLTNMYIWQHYYNSTFCIKDDIIYTIYDRYKDTYQAFMPYGEERNSIKVVDNLLNFFNEKLNCELTINLATQDFLKFLCNCGKYKIKCEELPNSFDYVYNVDDLIRLPGRKYHSKKNHFNSFSNKYEYEYKRYNKSMYEECINFCGNVIKQRTQNDIATYNSEMESIHKIFEVYDKLNLICSIITVNGEIVALSVSEQHTDDYALIHVEKAAYDYRGAYPVINRLTLENEFSNLKFVNREEDLGISGLRKAKRSYFPCKMIKKYRIKFINS